MLRQFCDSTRMAVFTSIAVSGPIAQAAPQFGTGPIAISAVLPQEPFFSNYSPLDTGTVTIYEEPFYNIQAGSLMPAGDDIIKFVMRGFKTSVPTGFVYWEAFVDPDPLGFLAPVPRAQLADIVVVAEVCGV